uniref:Uncharacterized protein n=1 Tax=Anguilla anguilla TaxID=7936 RepID=A0A0E9RG89_ANGAN
MEHSSQRLYFDSFFGGNFSSMLWKLSEISNVYQKKKKSRALASL